MKKQIRVSFEVMADIRETKEDYQIGLPIELSKFLSKQKFKHCIAIIKDKKGGSRINGISM